MAKNGIHRMEKIPVEECGTAGDLQGPCRSQQKISAVGSPPVGSQEEREKLKNLNLTKNWKTPKVPVFKCKKMAL